MGVRRSISQRLTTALAFVRAADPANWKGNIEPLYRSAQVLGCDLVSIAAVIRNVRFKISLSFSRPLPSCFRGMAQFLILVFWKYSDLA